MIRLKLDQFTVTGDVDHPLLIADKTTLLGVGVGGKARSAVMLN